MTMKTKLYAYNKPKICTSKLEQNINNRQFSHNPEDEYDMQLFLNQLATYLFDQTLQLTPFYLNP